MLKMKISQLTAETEYSNNFINDMRNLEEVENQK